MAGLWEFANCGYFSLTRGLLDRALEALGYPMPDTHLPYLREAFG